MLNFHMTTGARPSDGLGKVEIGLADKGFRALGIPLSLGGKLSREGQALLSWANFNDGAPAYPKTLVTGKPEAIFDTDWLDTECFFYGMSETDRTSKRWVNVLNRHYKAAFVPCLELETVYKNSGVKIPVISVGLGVDFAPIPFTNAPPLKEWRKPEHKFVVLTYTYADMRKGGQYAISTFNKVFGDDPSAHLFIKARYEGTRWPDMFTNPNFTLIREDLSEAEWHDLIRQTDAFMFPSFGEGFGLPPREATLCGVPAIATQWLGLGDVDKWGIPVKPSNPIAAHFDSYGANAEGAKYYPPNQDDLEAQLRRVYEMPTEQRQTIAMKGRRYLMNNFTWQQVAKNIMAVITAEVSLGNVNSAAA